MKLKTITISATFALLATTALSQTTRDDVVQMLSDQGFTRIEISRTFFGNTKFEAYGPMGEREIVLGKDGAVLRDHSEDSDDESSTSSSTGGDDESDVRDDDETDGSSDDERDDTSSSSDESDDTSDETDDADDDETDSSNDDENDSDENDDED